MFPVCTFELHAGTDSRTVFPLYGDGLSLGFSKESGEVFFRNRLEGELTFIGADYDFIISKGRGVRFVIDLTGTTWGWTGEFFLTDCEVDADARTIKVTPSPRDGYSGILAGMEKEYNLTKLAPAITPIWIDKRPCIQVYVQGSGKLGCILSGMSWEQDCEDVSTADAQSVYNFALLHSERMIHLSGVDSLPSIMHLAKPSAATYSVTDGDVTFRLYAITGLTGVFEIQVSGVARWQSLPYSQVPTYPVEVTMYPVNGATGVVTAYIEDVDVLARMICDVDSIGGEPTSPIPTDDMAGDNRNYTRCIGYDFPDAIYLSYGLSDDPTEWGMTEGGKYYVKPEFPAVSGIESIFPIARDQWDDFSIWWTGTSLDWLVEQEGRKAYQMRDGYSLAAVLGVLLEKATGNAVSFAETSQYSDFLYGSGNPVRGEDFRLFLTPKSNITAGEYDNAAQRGDISLRMVFDMLRDCFRCYWFIEDGKLRIEHISYFMNGRSYTGTPSVWQDLTGKTYSRSGKAIATGQNQYKFDKAETYGRIEFGWMDAVTAPFVGVPVDIVSEYVEDGTVESVSVSQFTSDIDYILLNSGGVSPDGFALLGAVEDDGEFRLPYQQEGENVMQNGYLSFDFLRRYYLYDLPAEDYEVDGEAGTALGTKRILRQTVKFPCDIPEDSDLLELVRTGLGDGVIDKFTINLVSLEGEAELLYE